MVYIDTIPESDARGELADLYRRLAYADGSVDDAYKALSLNPRLLAADAALYDTLMYGESPLSRVERELLALTVSRLNGCDRCVAHHAARYAALTAEAPLDEPSGASAAEPATDREQALVAFTTQLTLRPSAIRREDIDRLRQVGLEDRAILDACNVVAYFGYANRVTLGLGIEPAANGPGKGQRA
ncbi:MAG: peroxidase-related enzyme [Gemmatimonadales bacterium]